MPLDARPFSPLRRLRAVRGPFLALSLALPWISGCHDVPGPDATGTIRLVDRFSDARVTGSGEAVEPPEPTRWTFSEVAEKAEDRDPEWSEGYQVTGLELRGGNLVGRTTGTRPLVVFRRKSGTDRADVVHEVQVRMRASAGTTLGVVMGDDGETPLDRLAQALDSFPFSLEAPLIADSQMRTYTLSVDSQPFLPSFSAALTKTFLLQPANVADSDFEIESVRLVFRKEHLAEVASGVGWQGLSDVYRETVVTRSPEVASFDLTVPETAWLDVAIGTLEPAPVRFEVTVAPAGEVGGEPLRRLVRTISTPGRWEYLSLDLGDLAGRAVTLSLGLASDDPGAIGFWGAPALRTPTVSAQGGGPASAPQGIVVVVADTLRRDRLEAYGHDRQTAPHLAQMARDGVLFRDNVAQGAWTKVSVPSLMTSLYPTTLGIVEFADRVPAAATTMAEAFREAGYATWGSSSVPFSGRLSNLHQGYEVLHEAASLGDEGARSKTARAFTDRFLAWLGRTVGEHGRGIGTRGRTPFFAVLHFLDPHSPYRTYSPWDTEWSTEPDYKRYAEMQETVRPFIQNPEDAARGLPTRAELLAAELDPDEFARLGEAGYDASTRAMDVEIGRVFERLDQLGLAEDTLVVVLSDHGEEFLDHSESFHEHDVYGEMVNVPLIFRWPDVLPAGRVVEATVENLDVYPTLLRLAGVATDEQIAELGLQGHSLLPLLQGQDGADAEWRRRPAFSEWTRRGPQRERGGVDQRSIVFEDWKLIHNVERPADRAEFELYDHRQDPFDAVEVAAEHPEIVERLAKLLDGWHREAAAARVSDAEALEGMSDEELERLRSLGYIQ